MGVVWLVDKTLVGWLSNHGRRIRKQGLETDWNILRGKCRESWPAEKLHRDEDGIKERV